MRSTSADVEHVRIPGSSSDTDRVVGGRRAQRLGVAVTVVGLLLVALGGLASVRHTQRETASHLDLLADEADTQVNRRLEAAESALLTLAGGLSTGVVDETEVQSLLAATSVVEEVPGLLAMLHAVVDEIDGQPVVTPRAAHPYAPNSSVLGRNLLQDPARRTAIETARDTAGLAATTIVTHADGDVDAILLMVPVYDREPTSLEERRRWFEGVVIAVISPDELFASVARLPVTLDVVDTTVDGNPVAVWATAGAPAPDAPTYRMTFADRSWQGRLGPGEGFPVDGHGLGLVLTGGVLLAVLAGLLTAVLVGRREQLALLVDDRTRDLQDAYAKLERVGALRSQFITTVSHELRTPLTSVLGFIQTVRRIDELDPSVRDDFLARAERNGVTLRRMIEDLLDFGRLERGELELDRERLDVGRVVLEHAGDLRPALASRTVDVAVQDDVVAEVDRAALHRILANLLSNAVKYAPGDDPIEVIVEQHGPWVELVCRDRGPGFDPKDLPNLLERFVRGSGVMGEGTGIGLSLVYELALAHGGDAVLRNRPGGGAEVLVRLPAVRRAGPTAGTGNNGNGSRTKADQDVVAGLAKAE